MSKNGSDPLFMNRIRPFGSVEVRHSDFHKEIAYRRRIKNAGIKKGGELSQEILIPHVEFLRLCGKLIKDLAPFRVDVSLISQHVLKADAPMSPHEPEGELLLFKKLDQKWSGHVQKVGRFLSGEFGILWDKSDSTARSHVLQNRHQQLYRASRKVKRLLMFGITNTHGQRPAAASERREPLS